MHKAITNGTLRHFADDTNLLIVSKSVKKINREVNRNPSKTEIIIFKAKTKKNYKTSQFQISGQKTYIKNNVKYLSITIQDELPWKIHVNNLLKKLRRSAAILSKIRNYAPKWLIRTIY